MFPVTACLPMAPEERAIYFKRAQNWLARHRLVREAKTPLTVGVKSITETVSSLAKSSVRLSPPPYVKLDRLYITSSPQSPEPVKITSRLAPLIL